MTKKDNRLKIFSALEVANICGVVNQTSINWIKNNYLKAFTTPGGQYRVYAEDLIIFLEKRGMKIPEILYPVYESMEKDVKKGRKILLIDNDNNFAEMISDKITKTIPDCEIITASCSFNAGALFALNLPDIIILSDSLPEITPMKIRDLCISRDSRKKTGVIFLQSAKTRDEISKGADLVMVKPPDISKITSFIISGHTGRGNV